MSLYIKSTDIVTCQVQEITDVLQMLSLYEALLGMVGV